MPVEDALRGPECDVALVFCAVTVQAVGMQQHKGFATGANRASRIGDTGGNLSEKREGAIRVDSAPICVARAENYAVAAAMRGFMGAVKSARSLLSRRAWTIA